MRVIIEEFIHAELVPDDQDFLTKNTIFYTDTGIRVQKCDLPENKIWEFLRVLETYGYTVDLTMYSIGRFKLEVY